MRKRYLIGLAFMCLCSCGPQQGKEYALSKPPKEAPPAPPVVATPLDPTLLASARQELLTDTDSDIPVVRSNSLEGLRDADPADATDPAIKDLSDPNADVRFAACMAVGDLHIDAAHDRLLRMRDSNEPTAVQVGVRFALHMLGDKRFSHDLEAFAASSDPEVRGKTAMVLGLLGEPSAIPLLEPMMHDDSEPIRLQASESLWRLGDKEGLDALAAYAISKYPDDMILATLAMAAPHDEDVIGQVRGNLTSDYPEVSLATARALGMLGSDEGYTIATHYTSSLDPRQRFLAAMALGAIGRSDSQGALAPLLKDTNPAVRVGAATAILQLRPPG